MAVALLLVRARRSKSLRSAFDPSELPCPLAALGGSPDPIVGGLGAPPSPRRSFNAEVVSRGNSLDGNVKSFELGSDRFAQARRCMLGPNYQPV